MALLFNEIYELLQAHAVRNGEEAIDKNKLRAYFETGYRREKNAINDEDRALRERIRNLMVEDKTLSKKLKDSLPEINAEKSAYLKKLREAAHKNADAAKTKAERNQINAEKKLAKENLERIRRARISNQTREHGFNPSEAQFKVENLEEDISSARGRHLFTSITNYCSMGPRAVRRENVPYPVNEAKEDFMQIEHISEDKKIKLVGGQYTPKKPNGKVVIVFAGSGSPGAKQIQNIKDAYLDKGITVIQLDYRGFGKSKAMKDGKEVKTYPSEKTMYQDGMEMFKFVNKNLKVKPENIMLHGYSFGGPVAAKVALEATKQIKKERVENGKLYRDSDKIGGLVLQSPMKSMFYAARAQMFWLPGLAAKFNSGSYDTVKHLTELSKIDRDIPLHLIGGGGKAKEGAVQCDDYLSPTVTGLQKDIAGKFKTCTHFTGPADHDSQVYDLEAEKWVDAPGSNVSAKDKGLDSLIKDGRSREVNRNVVLGGSGL